MPTITETYQEQLRQKHQDPTWGTTGVRHFMKVLQLLEKFECKSVLDYGCGKGTLGAKFREEQKPSEIDGQMVESGLAAIEFYEFDPGIEGKDKSLRQADLVVCTDVLEHIEPACLQDVLADLRRVTLKSAFLVISTREAFHKLPDGRNAHLLVKEPAWWVAEIHKHFQNVKFEFVENTNELYVECR